MARTIFTDAAEESISFFKCFEGEMKETASEDKMPGKESVMRLLVVSLLYCMRIQC